MRIVGVISAAGLGRRLGADKALVSLDGRQPIVSAVVDAHRRAGAEEVFVVRRSGAAPLPAGLAAQTVEVDAPPEMLDSLRAGLSAAVDTAGEHAVDADIWIVHHPVDYPLATDGVLHALRNACREVGSEIQIVLPICGERPGHPIALRATLAVEILDPAATHTLRDVIRRDPTRVHGVHVHNPWVHRDLDLPEDLASARAYLRRPTGPVTAIQRAHRSHRAYTEDPVSARQLSWLVDSARHAATSSMMQAYAVIAVRDRERRASIAELCADQAHVRKAPLFLAICADLHKIEQACVKVPDRKFQAPSLELLLQASIDASLLAQNLQLAAESEGLGACMIGAARNHPVELAQLLGLPRHCYVVFGMTLGVPAGEPLQRERMPIEAVLHEDNYREDAVVDALDTADESMRKWARESNAHAGGYTGKPIDENRGWTDRMAWIWGRPAPSKGREGLADALRALGFDLR